MMGAVRSSRAISKTVNMPADATIDDVLNVYQEGWKLGLKAVAIYRDGCKRAQPLTTSREEAKKTSEQAPPVQASAPVAAAMPSNTGESYAPRRRRLPDERRALTHKFQISQHEGYITVGLYEDGSPGEVFITMNKEGSTLSGLLDSFATAVSVGLQYGVPLKTLVNKFAHMRFEPSGFTPNPNIRMAKSIVDYIFRWLGMKFLGAEDRKALGINVIEGGATSLEQPVLHAVETLAVKEFMAANPQQSLLDQSAAAPSPASGLSALTSTIDNQSDAPACDMCGSIMVRNAACYKCLNCGGTSGCS